MAKTTIDHATIQKWVEQRGGHPAHVKTTGSSTDPGILRIDFPGYSGEGKLEPIGWDQFFDAFDSNELAFIYQDRSRGGKESRFNKLVSRANVDVGDASAGKQARQQAGKQDGGKQDGGKTTPSAGAGAEQDAVELLTMQHRAVEEMFDEIQQQKPGSAAHRRLFGDLADALAIHATIEEKIFYPSVKRPQTEDLLEESVEEHLEVKRILATLMETAQDGDVSAELEELAGLTEEHVIEEEQELFPKVRKLLAAEELRQLAMRMTELESELRREGEPRAHIPEETEQAAPI
jgi:hemerythrin superfamily protein